MAAIDAGYSGDWSRIGVLTPELENVIKGLLVSLGFFHIFCGSIAAVAASKKGYNPLPATAKVMNHSCMTRYQMSHCDTAISKGVD